VEDEEAQRALMGDIGIIDNSLQYINDLLRDMLDIHRTANKKMCLNETPTDISKDIFEPVVSIMFMKENKAQILTECPDNLVATIDRLRVKQIILNLAVNASKFVEEGFIRLRAEIVKLEGNDKGELIRLSVEDSGPGIPIEKRDRIFAKFQESFDLLRQGTGIGLHICKSLSDLMGADLYLDESYDSGRPGCPGTRFVVDLHKAAFKFSSGLSFVDDSSSTPSTSHCESELTPEGISASLSELERALGEDNLPEKLSVLFVDDDMVLRKLFSRTVRRLMPSWELEEASNGETAVKLVDTKQYDLVRGY